MNTYTPKPLDTSSIVLPESLKALLEKLAENTHDVWATQRIKDGWTYGPKRDDLNKKHPCLIPYMDLPESEKVYDRNVAIEILKAVTAFGYRVEAETATT